MINIYRNLLIELRSTKIFIIVAGITTFSFYSIYLFLDDERIANLGQEDGFFEWLTVVSFFLTSTFFFHLFVPQKNLIYLLFAVVFLIGAGEEISWGQRILDFQTPNYVEQKNTQQEFNFHNLEMFNAHRVNGEEKSDLFSITFLYKLFCFSYAILLPILCYFSINVRTLVEHIKLPKPAISIGGFFLISWLIFRITRSFLLPDGKSSDYYSTIGEINECVSSIIFLLLSIYFYVKKYPYSMKYLKNINLINQHIFGQYQFIFNHLLRK